MLNNDLKKSLVDFRRTIHKFPELSWHEGRTAEKVLSFISLFKPDEIHTGIAGTGAAVLFRGKSEGPRVLVRCELDALPITETNGFEYRSVSEFRSHKCGHDGHMAIVAGLGAVISSNRPTRGELVLLFQPAEETGEGAAAVISDDSFRRIKPDFAFAAHNLPGFDLNTIVIRDGLFSAASKGMVVELKGKTSHASEPEKGNSPALPMSEIVQSISALPESGGFKDYVLATVVFAKLGEIALGTSPGYAKIISTLRAYREDDMARLSKRAVEITRRVGNKAGVGVDVKWTQEFPPTSNDDNCTGIIREIATENGLETVSPDKPFRWSEDFGHFTRLCPGAIFGIGAGADHPALHNPDYDFPEEIIPTGIKMFHEIVKRILSG